MICPRRGRHGNKNDTFGDFPSDGAYLPRRPVRKAPRVSCCGRDNQAFSFRFFIFHFFSWLRETANLFAPDDSNDDEHCSMIAKIVGRRMLQYVEIGDRFENNVVLFVVERFKVWFKLIRLKSSL